MTRVQAVIRAKDHQIAALNKKLELAQAENSKGGRAEVMNELKNWKERLDSYRSSIERVIAKKNEEIERLNDENSQLKRQAADVS